MAIEVSNEIERDLTRLASNRKISIAKALEQAIGEALNRDQVRAEVTKLQDEFASLPRLDPNFCEKDLYDEYGLPA